MRPGSREKPREAARMAVDMILVAGGSGFIGSAVTARLVGAGEEVRVMTAHPARSRERIERMGARAVAGDVLDPSSLARAMTGARAVIQAPGLGHAIVRPSWIYGPSDRALNRFVAFHRWLPFVPVVGDGMQRLQPVFIDDVAELLARAAATAAPTGTFEIGGPEVMT